jgi:phage portal protein BeeE
VLKVGNEWDDDEIRKLKREFKEQHEGTKNAHRILILTEGMEYTQLKEPTGNQTTPLVLNDVLDTHGMVFGVPALLLNPKSAEANTIKELKGLFWENTVVPMARLIQEAITKQLCMRVSTLLEVEFDFSNVYALRLHDLDRARVEVAHLNAGIKTANEIRLERGLDPLKFESSDMPFPEWSAKAKASAASQGTPEGGSSASPSLTMPGSQGGRDQSNSGEAQMIDQSAQRNLDEDEISLDIFKQ